MDRLTETNNYIGFMETYLNIDCEECQYKGTGECEEYKDECRAVAEFKRFVKDMYSKLKEYEDLEKLGKLLKLPCAVGDTVWYWDKDFSSLKEAPFEGYVSGYEIASVKAIYIIVTPKTEVLGSWCSDNRVRLFIEDFEKTIFHTREEAETALKNIDLTR